MICVPEDLRNTVSWSGTDEKKPWNLLTNVQTLFAEGVLQTTNTELTLAVYQRVVTNSLRYDNTKKRQRNDVDETGVINTGEMTNWN